MLTENIKEDIYDVVASERVLIIVALDVDALCGCKILKLLLQQDNTQYTVIPVSGKDELKTIYNEHKDQIKHFFLINCGGNIDLLAMLEAEEDTKFYVVDSHRPLDLNNVYRDQIKVIIKDGDNTLDEIPEAEKVIEFEEDEDESSENEDDTDQPSSKRQRTGDISYLEKKVKKKKWASERDQILDEYYESSYYGSSTAMVLYDLAWKLSKDNNHLLWLAIVGLTEQYLFAKIDRDKYFSDFNSLRDHVLRHNITDEEHTLSIDCMKISFENELRLDLYRHWSIFESFFNSQYTSCCVPIAQCKQKFTSMSIEFRTNVKEWIEELAAKYNLDDLTYGSFVSQHGYKHKFCAADVVYAITALLEYSKGDHSFSENFIDAFDALTRTNIDKLIDGIELAKLQVASLVLQVRSFIDSHQVVCAGPFLYAHMLEGGAAAIVAGIATTLLAIINIKKVQGASNVHMFSKPTVIARLARFTLEAYSVMTKNKRARSLPMIIAVPYNAAEGTSLLVGVPPVNDLSMKSFFGAAFKQASEKTKSRVVYNFFDPTVIEIKTEDRSKFFDNLAAIMA